MPVKHFVWQKRLICVIGMSNQRWCRLWTKIELRRNTAAGGANIVVVKKILLRNRIATLHIGLAVIGSTRKGRLDLHSHQEGAGNEHGEPQKTGESYGYSSGRVPGKRGLYVTNHKSQDRSLSIKEIRLIPLVQVNLYVLEAWISAVIGWKTPGRRGALAV